MFSAPLAQVIAKIRHTRYTAWRRNVSHNSLLPDSFAFFRGTGPSMFRPLSTVPASLSPLQPSFVLLPMQDKTEGEFFLQHLLTSTEESNSFPSGLSRI